MQSKNNPVYVCGCDRSGTTAFGSLIGGQEGYIAIPETHFIIEAFCNNDWSVSELNPFDQYWDSIKDNWRLKIWNYSSVDFVKSFAKEDIDLAAFIGALVSDFARLNGVTHFDAWVDHSPMNVLHVDWLLQLFPDAKFIHVVRDPRAVAASVIRLPWGPNTVFEFVPFWLQKVCAGLAAQLRYPNAVLLVKYEGLIEDQARVAKDIENFLGLDQLDIERRSKTGLTNYTRYQHRAVGGSLKYGESQYWDKYLTSSDINFIEGALQGVMQHFGYSRNTDSRNSGYQPTTRLLGTRLDVIPARVSEYIRRKWYGR